MSLSFTDGWDETVSVEFNLLQRTAKETLGRQITFEEFAPNDAMNKKVEDYVILEGIVVSNTKNHNAGENTAKHDRKDSITAYRTGPSTSKPTTANTASPFQTATAEDNVFEQYDHVQILIQGASGYLVETPDRYELRNVTKAMVISRIAGSASDVPVKEKWMSQLTDDDIYTYVTLKDVEFPVRKGAITPINEGLCDRHGRTAASANTRCSCATSTATTCTCLPTPTAPTAATARACPTARARFRASSSTSVSRVSNGATEPTRPKWTDDPTLGFIGRYQIRHQTKE